jgi:hypothetical protein
MIDRDAEAILVHAGHHAAKVLPVIRAPLEHIVLPLMDHFVGQRRRRFAIQVKVLNR